MKPTTSFADKSSPLYPVILEVPQHLRQLSGRAKVEALSRVAREALAISCRKSGRPVIHAEKDEKGAPLPEDDCYWSLSHKSRFVAAVAAPYPIGIDIEELRPVTAPLKQRIASEKEWRLGGGSESEFLFFRYWTAKEAVLKAAGIGMPGLSRCRITEIVDAHRLFLAFDNRSFMVTQTLHCGHLAAIVADDRPICWTHLSKSE